MPRYALTIEYDGGRFYGWQRQEKGIRSVQQTIEEAYEKFQGHPVTLYGAGRTDTGVHATGQVAHLDDPKEIDPYRMMSALNAYLLKKGVCIVGVRRVEDDFHARFSAKSRTYLYKILNRRMHPVLDLNRVWHVILPLDIDLMRQGANLLLGTHDFTSFRSVKCQASSAVRTLDAFDIWQEGAYIYSRIQSRSFLHNQVRIMMGTLAGIGHGRWKPEIITEMFEHTNRVMSGQTAPSCGLYLINVGY